MGRRFVFLWIPAMTMSMINLAFIAGAQNDPSLKNIFKYDFLIGMAISQGEIEGRNPAAATLILHQFNAVTPENIMKAEITQPGWNSFRFDAADSLVAFARTHQLKVNAHTLIWHSQLPSFMRNMQDADSVRGYFTKHINTVASRYDGKVYSWDVVNEALNENGTLRNSIFLQKLGDNYIVEAFRLAQKATPHSKLYYNDYNIEQPAKRAGAIALIKKIQAAGVRIDGVGIQGHWKSGQVPFRFIEESIQEFSALGIEVMFTELDLTVLPNPWDNNTADISQKTTTKPDMNPYAMGIPDSVSRKLAADYGSLFRLFLKYKTKIGRVTFWGLGDGQSWLNNWPIPGRTNYPLIFDRNLLPKPAFYSVIEAGNGQGKTNP